jgi:uncharacterized Tic20 family protein
MNATQTTPGTIDAPDRGLAAITHLSGLAGYILPGLGVVVPAVIWAVKKDSPVISTIAKQALLLNLMVFVLVCAATILFLTIILIPLVFLIWIGLGIVALALPIIGAVKASDGTYYRYPVIGLAPW